jgi:hypothetical protein
MRTRVLSSLLFLVAAACSRDTGIDAFERVRLGMSPRDVRARFAEAGQGTWQTSLGSNATDDTVLEWASSSPTSSALRAKFEFHRGMLVAVRANLREALLRSRLEVSPHTVAVQVPSGGGTDVTILARDCPTHHSEAESIAARHANSSGN